MKSNNAILFGVRIRYAKRIANAVSVRVLHVVKTNSTIDPGARQSDNYRYSFRRHISCRHL